MMRLFVLALLPLSLEALAFAGTQGVKSTTNAMKILEHDVQDLESYMESLPQTNSTSTAPTGSTGSAVAHQSQSNHKHKATPNVSYSWEAVPGQPGPCETQLCTLPADIQNKTCHATALYTSPPNFYVKDSYVITFGQSGYEYKAKFAGGLKIGGSRFENGFATILSPPVWSVNKSKYWEVSFLVGLRIPHQPAYCNCQIISGGPGHHPVTQSDWSLIAVPDDHEKTLWELCSPWLVQQLPKSNGHCPRYNHTAIKAWQGFPSAWTEVYHCEP